MSWVVALLVGCGAGHAPVPDAGRECGCDGPGCGCFETYSGEECIPDGECDFGTMNRCEQGRLEPTCGNGVCDCNEAPGLYYYAYGNCPQDCGCETGGCPLGAVEECDFEGGDCCAYDGECDLAGAPRRCAAGVWQDDPSCTG